MFEDKIDITYPKAENTMKRKIFVIIVAIFIIGALLIQLIPLSGRGNNPPVVQDVQWDSPQTANLARRACYDCHSNETVWPWYSYVAPVSWLIYNDVMEGRSKINFSVAGSIHRSAAEMADEIQEGGMPPSQYLIMHPQAKLTDAEKQQLITGLKNSLP
jgi:cytochrome c551/c552